VDDKVHPILFPKVKAFSSAALGCVYAHVAKAVPLSIMARSNNPEKLRLNVRVVLTSRRELG